MLLLLATLTTVGDVAIAETLFKAVSHDRNLEARTPEGLRLGVLYRADDDGSRESAETLAADVQSTELDVRPAWVELVAFEGEAPLYGWAREHHVSVLYVAAGLDEELPAIVRASEASGVLTLAGDPGYVEHGVVIGVRARDGSKKLLVNMGAAERCGVDFDGAVRQVAERVGGAPTQTGREDVRQALRRYSDAIQKKDLSALRTVWPGLGGDDEKRIVASFKMAQSHKIDFAVLEVEASEQSARARVRRTDRLVTDKGRTIVAGTLVEISFSKSTGGWIIDAMGKAAPLS